MIRVFGEVGDAIFIVKYDKLESSVSTEYDVPWSHITVILASYFYLSGRGGKYRVKQKLYIL